MKLWNSESGNRIPTLRRIPGRIGNHPTALHTCACLSIDAIAAHSCATCNIRQTLFELVEPWVQEPKRRLSGFETGVVEESDDAAEDWAGGAGPAGEGGGVVDVYCVTKGRNDKSAMSFN